jgi:hypothetical protein
MPLFERRDSHLDCVTVLAILEMHRLARSHPCLHLVESISISAQSANHEAVGDRIAFVKTVALAASVKDRTHDAIVRTCEHEAHHVTRAIAITKKSRRAGSQRIQRCGHDALAVHRTAPRRENRPSRDGGANREHYDNENRGELGSLHRRK